MRINSRLHLMKFSETLTQAALREQVSYNQNTGLFTRLISVRNSKAGSTPGQMTKRGYIQFCVGAKSYLSHRLAWLWMTGNWPRGEIDHIDGNPSNNKWHNLRDASHRENMRNQKTRRDNVARLKGVSWRPEFGKWQAQIVINGYHEYLGLFDCPTAAHCAYVIAAYKEFGEFARAN